jgi:hypothetical protein
MNVRTKKNTISGCVLVAVGAWAALAPFIAGTWVWEWHTGRLLLALLPGGAAALGGLMTLTGRRLAVSIGGGLALAGGIWLIVGPPVYALFVEPTLGSTPEGESIRMFQWVGFFFGAGAFISLLSSYVLGFLAPLEFGDEMWPKRTAATTPRARVPLPQEHPRRQRGVREPAPQVPGRARTKGSTRQD